MVGYGVWAVRGDVYHHAPAAAAATPRDRDAVHTSVAVDRHQYLISMYLLLETGRHSRTQRREVDVHAVLGLRREGGGRWDRAGDHELEGGACG